MVATPTCPDFVPGSKGDKEHHLGDTGADEDRQECRGGCWISGQRVEGMVGNRWKKTGRLPQGRSVVNARGETSCPVY